MNAIDGQVIGAFALGLLRELIDLAKGKAQDVAIDAMAHELAKALHVIPLAIRQHAQTAIAASAASAVARALHLSESQHRELVNALGVELVLLLAPELVAQVEALEKKMAKL